MNEEVLYLPKEDILRAAENFPTPFFLYEERRLRENCRRLRDAFAKLFSGFRPLYAVKANPNPHLLKIIISEGFGLDASSESEAWIAKKLGVGGMFTGNYNPPEELKPAKDAGFILNLDDVSMIPFLDKIGVPDKLSFRVNPGIGKASLATNVLAGPDAKFGIPFEQAPEAYKKAKEKGVKEFGIHMMTGSNVLDESYFPAIVERLFSIIADVASQTGIEISFMNIGGGFGVPYKLEEKSLDIEAVASHVRKIFDEQCGKHGIKEPVLFVEPGRYLTANAGWLVSRATVIKDGYKKFIGVDAASNDMPRPWMYGAYHHASVLNGSTAKEKVSIVGRLCENGDQLARERMLPAARPGDVVVIHNCGGHAYAMGGNYNGRPRHAEYLLADDGSFRKIRRAETSEDLYRTVESF